ncbi:hypothetical protein Pmani_025419 [Petrolisthes manimaculis]|uniref:Uncharacterized protein n=1 Tax=Petrolisthes manimaculis TaxID=1843537 RepID=A0AAE1P861_9EUCA|nr:hypothetical protein Pmani_025419 [Petrolisthes manimaculis]
MCCRLVLTLLEGESYLRRGLLSQDITQLVMDSDEDFELGSPEKLEALHSSFLYEPLFTVIERNYVASPQLDICITERDRRASHLQRTVSYWLRPERTADDGFLPDI